MKAVEALLNAGNRFIFRDVVFAAGGGLVILSLLYAFGQDVPETALYLVGVVVAYSLGYAIQDGLTMVGLVCTGAGGPSLNEWQKNFQAWIYRKFEGSDAEIVEITSDQYENAKDRLYGPDSARAQADHERIEALKQVGTTLGPCLGIAGTVLLLRAIYDWISGDQPATAIFFFGLLGMLLGIALWGLGWLKVTQQGQYIMRRHPAPKSRKPAVKKDSSSNKVAG